MNATHGHQAGAGSGQLAELVATVAGLVGDDAPELVAAWFDRPRHWPLLEGNTAVTADDWQGVLRAAAKRARGAPMPYAVGRANFRHLTLAVDERVLIPRPETELLVDLVLRHSGSGGTAVDVGTGSGAIAIALAREGTFERVIATDVSPDALEVARANAVACGAAVDFAVGDLLATTAGFLRAVVCNPPYIAFDEARSLPRSVRDWEPALALFSPRDGLAHTERLVAQAAPMLQDDGLLALEVDTRRASLVAELVARHAAFERVRVELDWTGRERFVLACRRRRTQR